MYKLIRSEIFKKDPEYVHERIVDIGKYLSDSWLRKLIEFMYDFEDERLHTRVFGIDFKNPVGLAAGFDKKGDLLDFLPSLGFGFIEIGSITTYPREGNPKPRIFRLPREKALLNKSGLPSIGVDKFYEGLKGKRFKLPIGVNIAKTHDIYIVGNIAIADISYSFRRLYDIGDYFTLNISCPNTQEGKVFEDACLLKDLLLSLNRIKTDFQKKKPVLLKLSPDLSYKSLDQILDTAESHNIDGYVISNTLLRRYDFETSPVGVTGIGECGESVKPLKNRSTELIGYVHKHLPKRGIIGVGGIFSARDAIEKIRAGASLIQVYTGLIYEGPGLVKKINKGLISLLKRNDFSSLRETVGTK